MGNFFSMQISGEDIWKCIAGQANYTCKLQENLEAMEQARDRLKDLRDDVKAKVDIAEQQPLMKRANEVEGWLSMVEKVIAEANQLIQVGPQQKKKLYLAGCFSENCCSTYKFGKAVVQNLENLVSLQDEGDFEVVTERIPAAVQMNLRHIEPTVELESTFSKVWNCIEKEGERIIAILGFGRNLKTYLLTQIHNHLLAGQNGFDIVIWVRVPLYLNIEKVQEDIAKKIGFFDDEFKSKTLHERASCIFNILRKKKFVLLLDDLWAQIDLIKVGIPLPTEKNGSKLIFTTRFSDVCDKMTAQKRIIVKCLPPTEAWELSVENVEEATHSREAAAQMNLRPIEPPVGLQSTFAEVWSCIENEGTRMIAICGIGGIGKTTLLTQIHNHLPTMQNGFDIVTWVTVSQDLRIEKIQDDIGKEIGFYSDEFENKTLDERAEWIFNVLRRKKFVLLLDDLWEQIDLIKVGIPFPIEKNGSKLIFTTRFSNVCDQMTAEKKIIVKCLPPKEAWELFVKNVGGETLASHPDIPELAKKVIDECRGLPLAIITIGRAMGCKKTPEAWNHAINVLRRSASSGMWTKKVHHILKFNYDCLPHDKLRSCFLYCCLFPEDFKIKIDDLFDFWIGEGFLDEYDVDFLHETQNKGHYIIHSLRVASLLEGNEEYVSMHGLIRDMGLWTACELEEETCLVQAGAKLVQVPEVEKWNKVKRLSLMYNEIEYLEGTTVLPTCSNLRTLFLRKNRLTVISTKFFQCMPNLTVLDLSENTDIWEVPEGISNLVSLEYLNLSSTKITEFPVELKSLKKLKCLNLDHIYSLKTIPQEVISSFAKLQVFRMFNSGFLIDEDNECLVLEELRLLKYLKTLTITIKRPSALQRFLSSHNLHGCIERISLFHFGDYKTLNVASLASMEHLREICFSRLIWLEDLKIEGKTSKASKTCFSNLCRVLIHECHELRELTWLFLARNLKHLVVKGCENLEAIISKGKLSQYPRLGVSGNPKPLFAQLEQLDLIDLYQLKVIYWHALPFPRLICLDVRCCPMLRELPLNFEAANNEKLTIKGEKEWWDQLEWEDGATRSSFLQSFKPHA